MNEPNATEARAARPAAAPPEASAATSPDPRWQGSHYVVREKRFTFGRQYRILDGQDRLLAYCKQKSFKLKEDIRFYADETQREELFRLQATKVIDFKGNFVVTDTASGRALGTLRRKGWRSLLRDEWHVLDAETRPWGTLLEDSPALAIARRLVGVLDTILDLDLIPYTYTLFRGPEAARFPVGRIKERFQWWGDTYDLTVEPATDIDRRVLIGLAVCVDAIEGR